jgi:hypothetical protein
MKYLKLYENFEDIDSICQKFGIKNYTINSDGSIDVDGNVDLIDKGLTKLPLKFRNVTGDFYCYNNQLTTLEGSPQNITGYFSCNNNKLTSLEGGPQSVGGSFFCNNNQLTSLEYAPLSVGGGFYCDDNPVESIWNLFIDYSQVDMLNDYDPVRDGGVIILDRLNEFLEQIGKPKVTEVKGYKCI